jgi:hypothetical protein
VAGSGPVWAKVCSARVVELVGAVDGFGVVPGAEVREDGVGEALAAAVGVVVDGELMRGPEGLRGRRCIR